MRSNFKSLWRRERIFYLELNSRGKGGLGKKKRSFGRSSSLYILSMYTGMKNWNHIALSNERRRYLSSPIMMKFGQNVYECSGKKIFCKNILEIHVLGLITAFEISKSWKSLFFSLAAWCVLHKDFLPWVLIGSARKVVL